MLFVPFLALLIFIFILELRVDANTLGLCVCILYMGVVYGMANSHDKNMKKVMPDARP